MTTDEVTAALMAEPRFAAMVEAEDGSMSIAKVDGRNVVSLYTCCAVKLMKFTVYAKTAVVVATTHMFKERSTGRFVAVLGVD